MLFIISLKSILTINNSYNENTIYKINIYNSNAYIAFKTCDACNIKINTIIKFRIFLLHHK